MVQTKTYLLENDSWFWTGLEDFCKGFDPNFQVIRTEKRDYMVENDYIFIAMIAQPSVERLIVASAFESPMHVPHIDKDEYWQVEHFIKLIEGAFNAREILGLGGLTVEINYHGTDFIKDVKREKWGNDFTRHIQRFVRQNPDTLVVNVYHEYKFMYRLTEENIY